MSRGISRPGTSCTDNLEKKKTRVGSETGLNHRTFGVPWQEIFEGMEANSEVGIVRGWVLLRMMSREELTASTWRGVRTNQ